MSDETKDPDPEAKPYKAKARRLRVATFPRELLLEMLRAKRWFRVWCRIPKTATIDNLGFDYGRNAFVVALESPEYDPIPPECDIPPLDPSSGSFQIVMSQARSPQYDPIEATARQVLANLLKYQPRSDDLTEAEKVLMNSAAALAAVIEPLQGGTTKITEDAVTRTARTRKEPNDDGRPESNG